MASPEIDENAPQFYIFIACSIEWEPFTSGFTIAKTLASKNVWLASQYTPFKKKYKKGDYVLLYVGGAGYRCFVGHGRVAGPTCEANEDDIEQAAELGLEGFDERIPLTGVAIWPNSVVMRPLVDDLSFVKDKRNYGLHLRQAVTRISEADYAVVAKAAKEANSVAIKK